MHPRTQTPVNCVWLTVMLATLLGLLAFAGPVAIGAVFSMSVVAQYISYSIPISARWMGGMPFQPGPFRLGILVRLARSTSTRFLTTHPSSTEPSHCICCSFMDDIYDRGSSVPCIPRSKREKYELHRGCNWGHTPSVGHLLLFPEVRWRPLVPRAGQEYRRGGKVGGGKHGEAPPVVI